MPKKKKNVQSIVHTGWKYARLTVNWDGAQVPEWQTGQILTDSIYTNTIFVGDFPNQGKTRVTEQARVYVTRESDIDSYGYFLGRIGLVGITPCSDKVKSTFDEGFYLNLVPEGKRTIDLKGELIPEYAYTIAKSEGTASPHYMMFSTPRSFKPSEEDNGTEVEKERIYLTKHSFYAIRNLLDDEIRLYWPDGRCIANRDAQDPIVQERDEIRSKLSKIREAFNIINSNR